MVADGLNWVANARVERFSAAQTQALMDRLGREPSADELRHWCGEPEDGVHHERGNILVTVGLNLLTELLEGGGGNPFSHADTIIGVGDSTTAAAVGDTHLGGDGSTSHAYYQQADVSYPTQSNGVVTIQGTFATGNGNFTAGWQEWCVASGSGGITAGGTLASVATGVTMLNHKVAALGTKVSGAQWVLTATITLA